jgi:hypothetical protein
MIFKTIVTFIVLLVIFLITSMFGFYSTETMMLFFKYSTYVCLVALGYIAIIFILFIITSVFNIPVHKIYQYRIIEKEHLFRSWVDNQVLSYNYYVIQRFGYLGWRDMPYKSFNFIPKNKETGEDFSGRFFREKSDCEYALKKYKEREEDYYWDRKNKDRVIDIYRR